jgi:hypothetical protein
MIRLITKAEFPEIRPRGGRALSAESIAIQELVIDAGFSTPCRWKHPDGRCSGTSLVCVVAKRLGVRLHATCRNGTLYVLRYE